MKTIPFWCVVILAAPATLLAQQDTASARMQLNCETAERALRSGPPQADIAWAHQRVRVCGGERAGAAIAVRLARVRTVADLSQLQQEWVSTLLLRDSSLFSTAVDVASDVNASVPARVFAFRSLRTLLFPTEIAEYEDLIGGPDERGWPQGRCYSARTTSQMPFRGRPLPLNWEQIARDAAQRVLADRSQPLDVRTAAACVLRSRIE
jgi:hypothetical protein